MPYGISTSQHFTAAFHTAHAVGHVPKSYQALSTAFFGSALPQTNEVSAANSAGTLSEHINQTGKYDQPFAVQVAGPRSFFEFQRISTKLKKQRGFSASLHWHA
jgi:hypothetical protein